MKRTLITAVLLAGLVLAQRGPARGGSSVVGGLATPAHGFGSIMFPGGLPRNSFPAAPVISPRIDTSFGRGLGAPYGRGGAGYGSLGGANGFGSRGGYRGGGGVVYAPYPIYMGGGYDGYGYGYGGYYPEPQQPVLQQQPLYMPQQAPTVIINQNFQPDRVSPQVRDYSNADLPAPTTRNDSGVSTISPAEPAPQRASRREEDKPTIYLVALKDGTILPALSTWVEGDTLNYITRDSNHNRVSLDRVDKDFSIRLNAERGLEIRLR
ncbi:MAG: hypothetical protein ACKV2U_30580 [Bryobacteraceae bacterium]